jgi:hypothetical protein
MMEKWKIESVENWYENCFVRTNQNRLYTLSKTLEKNFPKDSHPPFTASSFRAEVYQYCLSVLKEYTIHLYDKWIWEDGNLQLLKQINEIDHFYEIVMRSKKLY